MTKRVEAFCRELVEQCFEASGGRFSIYRLAATFRTGADNCLYFLGVSSIRLTDAAQARGAMQQAISRAERGAERDPPGPLPTTAAMASTLRSDGSSRPLSAARPASAGSSRPASAGRRYTWVALVPGAATRMHGLLACLQVGALCRHQGR